MATRKQRRRREKERRHEYEIVYVDQEGQEVEVDEEVAKPKKADESKPSGQKPTPGAKNAKNAKTAARPERTVDPPTWSRTFRRAAIFVPIMLIFLYYTGRKSMSTTALAFQAVVVVAILILFMYAMDTLLYRAYQKRIAKRGGSPPKSK